MLSRLATEVYSIERISTLLGFARRVVRELRLPNVKMKHGDGHYGLPDVAPFDGIVLAAAAHVVPPALLAQLADGGRLVMPRGGGENQSMVLISREQDVYHETVLEMVHFVPMLPGVA